MINTTDQVEQFYDENRHGEWERLDRHRTEFAITMRALAEFLPSPPAQVLDVGGGPGRYSIALAQQGYGVTLVDLSQVSLVQATKQAQVAKVDLVDIQQGNAKDLTTFDDAKYDAVLLLGPLYHLITQEERSQALQEVYRILKPDGLIFAAFLNRFSVLRICADRFPEWLVAHPDYVDRLLTTGVHQGEWGFTTAYHSHPNEIEPFMIAHNFATIQLLSCEGIVAQSEERINMLTGANWAWWADLNYQLGKDPALYGSAIHLLYVGQKSVGY